MKAWSGEEGDVMGPSVTRTASAKPTTPPLKNGNDLRESGYLIAVGSRASRFKRKYRKMLPLIIIFILLMLLIIAFAIISTLYAITIYQRPPKICKSRECLRSAANLAISMDKSADPCNNFYQYVCGNWASDHPRPDEYSSYDWFRDKQTKVYTLVRDFLNKNTSHYPKPVQQAKDMYTACMDTDTLNQLGLLPIMSILETLGLPMLPTFTNITNTDYNTYNFDWIEAVIKIKTHIGMDVLIGFDIFTDPKDSSAYRLVMGSPETTNPFPSIYNVKKRHDRERFLKQRKTSTKYKFQNHIDGKEKTTKDVYDKKKETDTREWLYAEAMKMFLIEWNYTTNINMSERKIDENIIEAATTYYSVYNDFYDMETDNSTEEEDDFLDLPDYTADELQTLTDKTVIINNGTPTPIWKRYLEGVFNISDVVLDFKKDKILVSNADLKYMSQMAAYVAQTPPVVLELYIWVKVAEVMMVHAHSELRMLVQRANQHLQTSLESIPPRSYQCANAVNDMLGLAVSYAIADPYFFNVTKPKIITMIDELKNALAHLVGQVFWMDDNTKLATYQKIIQMKTLVGFPDWLLEEGRLEEYYKGIEVDTKKHLENMVNVIRVKIRKGLNIFRDRNNYTWATDPTEVNAYHTFQENTITVPMVILQHPFYDLGLDSLNYGSLGTVLGHEITHGFDNIGRHFDKNGNVVPWWSNDTIEWFTFMTQCFVKQYSGYYVPELNQHVDGKNTLAENIADNGGLREAYEALQHHLRRHGPEEKLPGFEDMTSTQLFFLSYGNLWCGVSTRDSLEAAMEDEHTPQLFRAQGALQNNENFARAFRCPSGSAMNPEKRCIIF